MILASQKFNTDKKGPWLVWLHGLLGCSDEWREQITYCDQQPSIVLDLPGHGQSSTVSVKNFQQISALIKETLKQNNIEQYWLIGYSLGGRIAMYHGCYGDDNALQGIIIEAGNPGLKTLEDRNNRILHDKRWAQRLREEAIETVLIDWYQQPVFAELNKEECQQLVEKRKQNNAFAIADILENLSLGHQPWLVDKLKKLPIPFVYLCGERDNKFKTMAAQHAFETHIIPDAGHNTHLANSVAFGTTINHVLSLFD